MNLRRIVCLDDFEPAARRHLPASVFAYVSGGGEDGRAVAGNRAAFESWRFVPRVLVDVSRRRLAATLFGEAWSAPFGIAPMGAGALCRRDADLLLAGAARDADVPFVLSGASTVPLERVLAAAPRSWFQAYIPAQRSVVLPLLARLRAAGVETLVVTVDVPIAARREAELREGFSVPLRPSARLLASGLARPRWLAGTALATLLRDGAPHFENYTAERGRPVFTGLKDDHRAGRDAMTWDDMAWIRDAWRGRLVIKGLLCADDARRAQALGADAIVVSNHGGRQLNDAIATLDALPAVRAAVPGLPVLLDGGVRRGSDVLKALALGADFVFVGRPFMHAVAVAGAAGVAHAIELLRRDLDVASALAGCPTLADVDRTLVVPRPAPAPYNA